MKKIFAMMAITGVMAACNNDSESTETTDSTIMMTPDGTSEMDRYPTDSSRMILADSMRMTDTSKMMKDPLRK